MFRTSKTTLVQLLFFFCSYLFVSLSVFIPTVWGDHLDVQVDVTHNGYKTEYYKNGDNLPPGNVIHVWPGDDVMLEAWPWGNYTAKTGTVTFTLTGEEKIFLERDHTNWAKAQVGILWPGSKINCPGVYLLEVTHYYISWNYQPTLVFHESDRETYNMVRYAWKCLVYDQADPQVVKREYRAFDDFVDVYPGERLVMKTNIGTLGYGVNWTIKFLSTGRVGSREPLPNIILTGPANYGIIEHAVDWTGPGEYRLQIFRGYPAGDRQCEVATSLGKVIFHENTP